MKIDIEKLAREAGFEVHPRKHQIRVGADALLGLDSTEKVHKFAVLMLEGVANLSIECGDDVVAENARKGSPMSEDWMRGSYGMSRLVAEWLRTISRQITEGK